MINSYGDSSTARFAQSGKNKFSGMSEVAANARLALLNDMTDIKEIMGIGKLRLHGLSGDLKGFWSIDINGPWRLIFKFIDGDAEEVTIINTH